MVDSARRAAYRDKIYGADWKAWKDPEFPEIFNPTELLLDKHMAGGTADCTALIVDNEQCSYRELLATVCQAGHGLLSLGLESENRILLFANDSLDFIATWLGAVRAGIVPIVVSDQYKAPMLLYFLRDTAAKAMFIDTEQIDKFAEIADDLPATLQQVIFRGDAVPLIHGPRQTHYRKMIDGRPSHMPPLPRHCNDIAYMFYSGGTTGTAKGITHLVSDFPIIPERHGAFWEYGPDDVVHATSKKFFTHGLWPGVLIPLYWGATSVISRLPPIPENVIAIVESLRVTKLITVPTIIKNMMQHVESNRLRPDFSSLNLAITASEKMPAEIFQKFHDTFGVELLDSIGSSEITYEWIANRPRDFRRGSLGKPVFGVEIRLVGPNGAEITEPNTDGEAWVNSRTACFYYWRKYDKSKETFIGQWTRTGDMMYFDEDGYFWFSGRSDDVFKVKGLWVSPIEIEAELTEHDAVLEAAVISVEDSDGLTSPKAFVVLRPGSTPSDALTEALKSNVQQIGGYKVPRDIVYVDDLPRTTLLKIDRRALR
ncbi:MAG: benzoate-CoA ligase family protein, partial [Rhodospirillales bacterium]|nr:benzoate-CoA ligase family protein [Rhodospirillales bacterium]